MEPTGELLESCLIVRTDIDTLFMPENGTPPGY